MSTLKNQVECGWDWRDGKWTCLETMTPRSQKETLLSSPYGNVTYEGWRDFEVLGKPLQYKRDGETTMKTHVTIDGLTLSREQIEKAYQELNKLTTFQPGDVTVTGNLLRFYLSETDVTGAMRRYERCQNRGEANILFALRYDEGDKSFVFDAESAVAVLCERKVN